MSRSVISLHQRISERRLSFPSMQTKETFMVCDAGGGTVVSTLERTATLRSTLTGRKGCNNLHCGAQKSIQAD
jgi:hypothetical protein